MIKITITLELSDKLLSDIMCTALESGAIRYWCEPEGVECVDDPTESVGWRYRHFRAIPVDESDFRPGVVTYQTLATGIERILQRDPKCRVNDTYYAMVATVGRGEEECDIDSEGADIIVQAGLLGEIKFG